MMDRDRATAANAFSWRSDSTQTQTQTQTPHVLAARLAHYLYTIHCAIRLLIYQVLQWRH